MSTKIFLCIILTVLVVAGYVAYMKVMEEGEPIVSDGISFLCNDASYFMAEFSPEFDQVNIIVDGIVERSLVRISDTDLYAYEDSFFLYTFAGEEAVVTAKSTNTKTACTQPFDPNNAPYNFGDLGEGGGERVDLSLIVRESLPGQWLSEDDENFSREFLSNGTAVDRYEGTADTSGTWEVFNGQSGVETPFPQSTNEVYLKMVMGEMSEEVFYFQIGKLTPEELELVYMDRGGVLRFSFVESTE